MYDIDRALRRLELAHRLEELDKARTAPLPPIPSPSPVPPTSAPLSVIADDPAGADAQHSALTDPPTSGPRTLPNGLPVRTPGTKFRTSSPPTSPTSRVVIPLGDPLPPVGSADAAHRLLARANPLAPPSAPPAPLPAHSSWEARPLTGWAADHDIAAAVTGAMPEPVTAPAVTPGLETSATREAAEAAEADAAPGPAPAAPAPAVAAPGDLATRPGQLPVSQLLAGLLSPPPSEPVARAPRGAFTPSADLPGAVASVYGPPQASVAAPLDANDAPTEHGDPEAHSPESSAAERIAAMLRGGAPGLLA